MTSVKEKKRRLMSENAEATLDKPKIVLKPVVGDEFSDNINITKAFAGILKDKKNTATAIKSLTTILPLPGYFKRCSNGKLLLTFFNDQSNQDKGHYLSFTSQEDLKKYLIDHEFNLELLKHDFLIVTVPKNAPKTKIQAKKASHYWPVNFHPDLHIEELLSGDFFNSAQLEIIEACMKVCIESARRESIGNDNCNGSTVIFNPNDGSVGRIIAVAASRLNEHPLWHSAMLAVDLVAKMRGRGAWKLITKDNSDDFSQNLSVDYHKRKLECQQNPLCYPECLNSIDIPIFTQTADIKSSIKYNNDNNDTDCSYLCTSYWAFLLQEPCPLCAMALLHSRVSMIFYGASNKSRGVLGSKSLLHTLAGLNHRYKVWSSVLEDDCMRIVLEISQRSNKII
ncbi:probable inactive tRNA-specific adenosine deaminase-like protein 3 [Chelonus insularis]|uniref:probable inactive tRNA-specific adenosine deaminase-like protein 3 n=1 Tax=Chelonus insularis TaxID=460826 RepID=UPI001589844E|nr:probable inactive tRNA-specific adenosine deaminase-like protein 3 [Chelonus insularis]XP_034946702.1 probable inactive tRNA-specific adenosine deaminase-like protein 3 [Chelonus insularis]XP_034946703.1 probable inactive tRNA-specific adenosine deaminase-like protein 3 [Chelonus insularis]XP_034946704.1 probable inactive tRNA-specific adenosine deaminase-like protein 3 [Chelonus insularis]XP_034946705.1 probable inactive tRNA-specific adenosine deaminase-like protein 3 [Chelonus insularis]